MAREQRIEYPGAICQVMARGDRREDIGNWGTDPQRRPSALRAQNQRAQRTSALREPARSETQRAQRLFSDQVLHPVAEDYYLLKKDYFHRIYLFENDK